MNIAYIDICRLLELKQKRKHIISYKCRSCDGERYYIWRSHEFSKCLGCGNEIRLEDMKEEIQGKFEEEHAEYKEMMETARGVC